jgi:hypothetical protein
MLTANFKPSELVAHPYIELEVVGKFVPVKGAKVTPLSTDFQIRELPPPT